MKKLLFCQHKCWPSWIELFCIKFGFLRLFTLTILPRIIQFIFDNYSERAIPLSFFFWQTEVLQYLPNFRYFRFSISRSYSTTAWWTLITARKYQLKFYRISKFIVGYLFVCVCELILAWFASVTFVLHPSPPIQLLSSRPSINKHMHFMSFNIMH